MARKDRKDVGSLFLAVVNRTAGGGRCGKLADSAIADLRARGLTIDTIDSQYPGHATQIVREAYHGGVRRFISVGGDGTAHEIVNGLYPEALEGERPHLAFLPLGTGNSFLRDFSLNGLEHAVAALVEGRERPCDVLRMTHRKGAIHSINLLSIGFTADVAALTNRKLKGWGELGYLLGVIACLLRLRRRAFPHRVDESTEIDGRRCLFLTFNNSKYTGGKMMIAPQAETADGLVEFIRWGPIGRIGLMRNLNRLYDGSHVLHPLASRSAVRRVEFFLDGPVDVMIDGEVVTLHCQKLEVLPSVLTVYA